MGMYTKINARIAIKASSVPIMQKCLDGVKPVGHDDHELFQSPRWDCIFSMSSAYFSQNSDDKTRIECEDFGGYSDSETYVLIIDQNLKNYNNEIEAFFNWMGQYTEDLVLGYSRYEECEQRRYYLNKHVVAKKL